MNDIERVIELVVLAKGRFLDSPEKYEALHIAKEALEKQMPKKPTEHYNWCDLTTDDFRWYCKNCDNNLDETEKHCPNCGQCLDWEVE